MDQESLEQCRILPNPEVVAKRLDEELVIIHLGTDQIYSLNSSAARFWELLESGVGVLEAKEQLLEEFAVSMQELDEDIRNVLKLLLENQLITVEK
ncbi:MAG: PqqD family protein [Candidatus Binatia bacterium]